MEHSENINEIALALSKAQSELNGVGKKSENPFFKSKYAELHDCIEAAREPLSKNGLAVTQTTDIHEKGIVIITTLIHSSGQWIRGRLLMSPKKKDDDQATGSSITYGRRYGFAAIVGLAQKDDDGNSSVGNINEKNTQNKGVTGIEKWKIKYSEMKESGVIVLPAEHEKWIADNKVAFVADLTRDQQIKFKAFLDDNLKQLSS